MAVSNVCLLRVRTTRIDIELHYVLAETLVATEDRAKINSYFLGIVVFHLLLDCSVDFIDFLLLQRFAYLGCRILVN